MPMGLRAHPPPGPPPLRRRRAPLYCVLGTLMRYLNLESDLELFANKQRAICVGLLSLNYSL
jgi:hypothetical protein